MADPKKQSRGVCAVQPASTVCLVSTGTDPGQVIPSWAAYARDSRPGATFWMNGQACAARQRFAPPPAGSLGTLKAAVDAVAQLTGNTQTALAMFMHGTMVGTQSPIAIIQSGVLRPFDDRELVNPDWNPPYLYLGRWPERNENRAYHAFTSRLRGLTNIGEVHLIGCRLGGEQEQHDRFWVSWGLLDFASDINKKVIAYIDYTHVSGGPPWTLRIAPHSVNAPTSEGVWTTCDGYYRFYLCTNYGRIGGWQVRCYDHPELGWVLEHFDGRNVLRWSRDHPRIDPALQEPVPNARERVERKMPSGFGCRTADCQVRAQNCEAWSKRE